MNMRTLLIAAAGAAMTGAAQAGTFYWTGAVDGAWTNAANWAENQVPGQYYDATGTKTGAVGDTVYFDDAKLSGNKATTISFDGVYSVSNLYTTGSTRFTYGTAKTTQYVPIEPAGTFSAAETATTPPAAVVCRLRLGVDFPKVNNPPSVCVRNNSANEFAITNNFGYMTKVDANTPSVALVSFEGTGPIRLAASGANDGTPYWGFMMNMTQPLVIGEGVTLAPRSIKTANGLTTLQRIELKKGASIVPLWYGAFFVSSSLELFGEGTFCYRVNGANSNYYEGSEVKEGATLTFNCPIKLQDDTKSGVAAYTYCYGVSYGYGTIVYGCPSNDCTGTVIAKGSGSYVTFSQDSFGTKGTYSAMGDVDFDGGVLALRHTGAEADTTDRAVALTNVNSKTLTLGKVKLEQAGAGAWTVNSAVSLKSGVTSGQLVLAGATGVGAATFGGSLADGISVTKTESGTWTFAPKGDSVGTVSFSTGNAGTLVVGKDLTMASVSVASSSATLAVAAGKTLTISALTITDGKVLDIVLEDAAASVKLANATSVPAGLTLNGHAAVIGEGGVLTVDPNAQEAIWKSATDGAWTDGTKWSKGAAPDGTVPVYVDANGADYAVTIDSAAGSSLALTNLVVDNVGAGTATVKIDGVPVTIKGNSTTAANAQNPLLTVGKGGAVEVKDAMLQLHDLGKEGTGLNGSSLLRQEGGSLTFSGTASLDQHPMNASDLPSSTSKTAYMICYLCFGTGLTSFKDDASLSWTVQETSYSVNFQHIQPYLSGETAEVLFTDRSYINFAKGSPRMFMKPNDGVSRLTIDTSYEKKLSNAWSLFYVGYAGSGLAELNLKNGNLSQGEWGSFHVAVPNDDDNLTSAAQYFVTGRVDIAKSASFLVYANQTLNDKWQYYGVQIGQGTSSTCERGKALYHGEMNVAGGFEQQRASLLVGAGPCGEGAITQTDGSVKIVTDPVKYPVKVSAGGAMSCAVALGAFGGKGSYAMTGGTFESGLPVYVGGILTNDLNRLHANSATFDKYHDAQGALTISGGTFATTNNVVLGRDGTGVLTLSGAGVLKAATIDVRQTAGADASEIRFVADANGKCGKIDAKTMAFAAGSRVVVDVSKVPAENPKSAVLWELDEAPEGLTEEMLVLQGNESVAIENGLKLENGGRRLAWRVARGAVLIIR